jgi:ABC-type branched-subunit amino acid transport system substrate-binding protein
MDVKTRWLRPLLLLMVLSLLAAACRGAEEPAAEPTPAETPTPAATPTEPEEETETPEPTAAEVATDVGVTEEPCPDGVNPENGCIYLGVISDLTVGPFAALAVPITEAQEAFWRRVNEDGGIGGYDIDVTTYVRDNEYNPEVHNRVFQEIRGDILALAQTLGSPQTAAILPDMDSDDIVGAPASWTSAWEFQDVILESGTNYCFESMNSVDWYVEEQGEPAKIMAVHYPGDYGDDAAAGARYAAEQHGVEFVDVETPPGQDNQGGAIEQVVAESPDLLLITTGPAEMATIVGQAAARGFQGVVVGTSPTWNPALLQSAAAPALEAMYFQSGPWGPWGTDTPGHEAAREAFADVTTVNDGYIAGWVWSYPIKAAIERAVENGDLTRAGLRAAVTELTEVDYEGMLPADAGNFAGEPEETVFRQSLISRVDPDAPTGVSVVQDFFVGPTAEGYQFDGPCFES